MQLCHLYHNQSHSTHTDALLNHFQSTSLDVDKLNSLEDYDIYIIDIFSLTKAISLKLKELFASKALPLIYFDIPDTHSIMHIQLAVLLNTKSVITSKQDTQKVIKKITKEVKQHKQEQKLQSISTHLHQNELLFSVHNKELTYISPKANKLLCEEQKDDQYKKLNEMFQFNELNNVTHSFTEHNSTSYLLKKIAIENEDFFHLLEHPELPNGGEHNYLATRIKFLELLKDKILIETKNISFISINIKNLDYIEQSNANLEVEDFLNKLLAEINIALPSNIQLSQYDGNYYIALYEELEFEELKEEAKRFHSHISNYLSREKIVIHLQVYAIMLGERNLNEILDVFNHISNDQLTTSMKKSNDISCIDNIHETMSDEAILTQMLESISTNHSKCTLLNIYKGLCINTTAEILKITLNTIQLKLEDLQTKIVFIQKKSILEIPSYTQSIAFKLQRIDLKNNIATFEHYKLMKTNMNMRKHGRVQPEAKTSITLISMGASLKGHLLDISLKSLAFKAPYTKLTKTLKDKIVIINFELTLNKSAKTFLLEQKAKVMNIIINEEEKSAKVICEILSDHNNEHTYIDYVYQRQKSIIKEIKALASS